VDDQTDDDEVPAPFGGRAASDTGAFGTLSNLDEFTRWQWLTIADRQTSPGSTPDWGGGPEAGGSTRRDP
jgi:hypothetical protein